MKDYLCSATGNHISFYNNKENDEIYSLFYKIVQKEVDEMERDRFMLEILAKERTNDRKKESNVSEKELNHAIYGLTLRIEEKACLLKLKEDCDTLLQSFKKAAAKRYTTCTEQPCKRIKL